MTREALRSQSAGVKNAPKCVAQAEDLQTGYGKKKVSEGIQFSLRSGEILAVIGPNGSGKTFKQMKNRPHNSTYNSMNNTNN